VTGFNLEVSSSPSWARSHSSPSHACLSGRRARA
jgi:hypothetical protein